MSKEERNKLFYLLIRIAIVYTWLFFIVLNHFGVINILIVIGSYHLHHYFTGEACVVVGAFFLFPEFIEFGIVQLLDDFKDFVVLDFSFMVSQFMVAILILILTFYKFYNSKRSE